MKKVIIFFIIFTVLSSSTTVYAGSPSGNALRKLGRGVANIVTCPYEIFYRVGEANDEDGPVAAFSWGILNGVYRTALRAVVGVYEVITFPIPIFPKDYRPIIDDPEFFMQDGFL